jgi:hypothetical protein
MKSMLYEASHMQVLLTFILLPVSSVKNRVEACLECPQPSPASRKRRQKGNPVSGVITGLY